MELLKTVELCKNFGGLSAVNHVNLSVNKGEIISVIGPNGAGKSTYFNLVSRMLPLTSGEIYFKEKLINKEKPNIIAGLGISRTFQNVRLFKNMSVLENVLVGFHVHNEPRLFEGFKLRTKQKEKDIIKLALENLEFVGLKVEPSVLAKNISYGQQRLLEISRALSNKPELLLLDEPAAGLNTEETLRLLELIRKIQAKGITVLLVEHNVGFVMELSSRIVVLNFGQKIFEGTPDEARVSPVVIEAYLGEEVVDA